MYTHVWTASPIPLLGHFRCTVSVSVTSAGFYFVHACKYKYVIMAQALSWYSILVIMSVHCH